MEQVAAPQQLAAKDISYVCDSGLANEARRECYRQTQQVDQTDARLTVPALGIARSGRDNSAPMVVCAPATGCRLMLLLMKAEKKQH